VRRLRATFSGSASWFRLLCRVCRFWAVIRLLHCSCSLVCSGSALLLPLCAVASCLLLLCCCYGFRVAVTAPALWLRLLRCGYSSCIVVAASVLRFRTCHFYVVASCLSLAASVLWLQLLRCVFDFCVTLRCAFSTLCRAHVHRLPPCHVFLLRPCLLTSCSCLLPLAS
jgi:hypothetical protein